MGKTDRPAGPRLLVNRAGPFRTGRRHRYTVLTAGGLAVNSTPPRRWRGGGGGTERHPGWAGLAGAQSEIRGVLRRAWGHDAPTCGDRGAGGAPLRCLRYREEATPIPGRGGQAADPIRNANVFGKTSDIVGFR